jgi:hypothetical protein
MCIFSIYYINRNTCTLKPLFLRVWRVTRIMLSNAFVFSPPRKCRVFIDSQEKEMLRRTTDPFIGEWDAVMKLQAAKD